MAGKFLMFMFFVINNSVLIGCCIMQLIDEGMSRIGLAITTTLISVTLMFVICAANVLVLAYRDLDHKTKDEAKKEDDNND